MNERCKDCGTNKRELLESGYCIVCNLAQKRAKDKEGNWKDVSNPWIYRGVTKSNE